MDSPALWNRFHNERILPIYGDHLEFKDNFEPADLLLIVGTLQYILDDIPSFLNNVLISSSPQAVIFSRSPMLDEANDQFVSQIVSLLDETDKESKWVIPIRVHSLQLLIAEMQKLDFELWRHSKKWPYKLANCNDLKDTFYIDLYFKRNIFRE